LAGAPASRCRPWGAAVSRGTSSARGGEPAPGGRSRSGGMREPPIATATTTRIETQTPAANLVTPAMTKTIAERTAPTPLKTMLCPVRPRWRQERKQPGQPQPLPQHS
jgi:hypothetical protein